MKIKSYEFNLASTIIICESCGQANPECLKCNKLINGDCYCGDIAWRSRKLEVEHYCGSCGEQLGIGGDEGYLGCGKYNPYSVIRMMEEAQYEVIKKIEDKMLPIETNDITGFVGMKKDDFNVIKKELLNEELK